MNKEIARTYKQFRAHAPFMLVGENARLALESAKTLLRFRELEDQGLVCIKALPEEEDYFDVFGEPDTEKERKSIIETLERDGCWYVVTEYLNRVSCTAENCACPFHRAPARFTERRAKHGNMPAVSVCVQDTTIRVIHLRIATSSV